MVSPQDSTASDIAAGEVRGRGFVREEIIATTSRADVPSPLTAPRYSYPVYFWGSVVAGSVLVFSLFCLSYLLMLGFHVGVDSSGMLALGWGAAIWFIVTSCIAYYFGGMLSNCIAPSSSGSLLKGATVWGLSIPLALVISAVFVGGSGLFAGLNMPHFQETVVTTAGNAQQVATNLQPHLGLNFGFIWTAFVALICGLFFSIAGSASAIPANLGVMHQTTVTP